MQPQLVMWMIAVWLVMIGGTTLKFEDWLGRRYPYGIIPKRLSWLAVTVGGTVLVAGIVGIIYLALNVR